MMVNAKRELHIYYKYLAFFGDKYTVKVLTILRITRKNISNAVLRLPTLVFSEPVSRGWCCIVCL